MTKSPWTTPPAEELLQEVERPVHRRVVALCAADFPKVQGKTDMLNWVLSQGGPEDRPPINFICDSTIPDGYVRISCTCCNGGAFREMQSELLLKDVEDVTKYATEWVASGRTLPWKE